MTVTIILIIIVTFLIAVLFLLKKEIRAIKRQVHERTKGSEKPVDVSLIDKDITELASEINELMSYCKEQSIEMLKREQQLKETITHISHDLRTPLTSIVGHLQLLKKTDLMPEQREFVETVLSRSEDLRNLINVFYDLSLLESKENIPNAKKINLDNMLTESILDYTEQFERKGITPQIMFLDEPTFIIADEVMLKRVVDNLILNAAIYGTDKLNIIISKGDNLSIIFQNSVQDVQTIDINRIFDKFYMADSSRSHSGTGIGLYVVKLLVEKMGGTVKAIVEGNCLCIVLFLS